MNNRTTLLLCGALHICLCLPAFAQDLNWYHRFNCSNSISFYGLNADTSGHLYLGGFFKGNCDFDLGPSEYWLSTGARSHLYVEKMRSDGTMLWVREWEGDGLDTFSIVLGFDKYGNTYLQGRFTDSVDFDPGPGEYWMQPTSAMSNFLLKLDHEGQFAWAIQQPFFAVAPVADHEGNVWLAAEFNGAIDADPGPGVFPLQALPFGSTTALVKLDSAGKFVWATALGRVWPEGIAIDLAGNFYLRGAFRGTVDLDPGLGVFELTSGSPSSEDRLNLKLNSAGQFVWASHTARGGTFYFGGMEVDAQEQVYMSTQIIGTCDVDPGPGVLILDASINDILVMKLDAMGNLAWANHLKNPSLETVLDLKLDAQANCYVTGYLNQDADMDPSPAVVISPNNRGGSYDAYLLKFDSAGAFNWATRYGGKDGEWGTFVAVDGSGRVTAGGPSSDIMDFGNLPGEDFIPSSNQKGSFFLVQVSQDGRYAGTVFNDLNKNELQDADEPGVPNMVLRAAERYTSTNTEGHYRFTSDISGDTLRVMQLRPYWNIEPQFALPDTLQLVNDFAFSQPDTVLDAALQIASISAFRPGFRAYVWMEVQNLGNTLMDSVRIRMDSFSLNPVLSVTSSTLLPHIQTPERVEWRIDSLQPGGRVPIRVQFHTPDTVKLGTPIDFPISVLLAGDLDTSNNHRRIQTTIRGSFDPNDKLVTPEVLPQSNMDNATLQYLIRFQNTGTLPAEFVILRDTLPATVDLGSLEILGASHAFTWRLRDARILEIHFNQIHLPDSLSDPQGSQGFAAFRIRPSQGLQLGDSVINRAGIYFDYNPPVITPAAVTVLTNTSTIPTAPYSADTLNFNLLPNPAATQTPVMLSLSAEHPGGVLRLSDLNGRTLLRQAVPANLQSLRLPGLPGGWYVVEVQIGTGHGARLLLVE